MTALEFFVRTASFFACLAVFCVLCTKLLVGSLFATSNAGEEFLRNLEKFEFATSKLEWVIDDFKDNKNDSHPMVVENVGDLLDELDTHVSGIADACKALADYWVGASSTTISDELNAEGELLAPVQGLVDFLYNQYQCLVERKSAPYLNIDWTIMPQPEVDAEDLLGKISEHIASIPAKVAELIDEIVRVNNHNINNLIFGIDISKLSAEIANLKTVFTQKPLDANADINTAVLGVLDTASSSLDELQFEHRACLAEYIGSLARVECVTSAICSQIQKIISFNFGEPKNIDTIVECIVEITSHVEEIKDSMAKTNEIFDTNECIIHPAFIKELREMYDHVFGCFSEIEKIYYNYTETPSGVTVLAENVHHTVGDVSDIMGRIIDNVESMVNHIPAIFEGFSQNYIQEIGVELVKLDASLTSLGGQCAGSDTSLLSALPAGVCCPHKNIKISDFLINIATLLNGFPPIDTTLCCSHIFNEMHNIYHCCFKTLRLLETVFNADEMYFANKHSAWRNILSLIQEFIVKITETGSINGRPTPDDGKCYGVNLKVYLQTVCAEFEEMTDNLDEHIQSLNLPNFVPYFRTTYTDKGCRTLTFFLTGIGEIVEKIEELFPTFIEKIEVSSYAVDANLKGLVISTSQALENFVGQVGDEIGKKIPMLSTLCSKCDDGVWALIKTNLLDLVTLAQKIANEQLSTPRCCRDPGQILLNTGQTLFKIDQVIQRIGIETSCISSDDATILISNVDRGTEILSCILNQVSAMQSSGGDSACFLQRKIQNISEIDTQVQNLLDVALKVHEVFGGTPFAFEVAPFDPYDDKGSSAPDPNLCDYFDDIVEFVSTHLTGIGSHISEFNESLLARDRAFYSDELLASITAFVGEFFKISKQINSVHEYVESNLIITCGNHSPFFSEEIASIYGELVKIPVSMKDFCCSSISQSFYILSRHLAQMKLGIDATLGGYAIDLPPPDLQLLVQLSLQYTQVTSLLNDIINLKSNLTGSVCNLQKVSKQFAAIAKILGESSAAFVALCEGIGITPGDPDSTLTTFKSANATSNALSMATEYVDCLNSLGAAAIALRATPPLLANYQELLAFVTNAKDMFTSLQQVTVFFMEQFKASSTTKLLCDKCEAFDSPPSPPDESTIVVPDIPSESDIVDDFDEVLNVLSHPGCCTYLADTAVDSANLLKGLSLALSRLSNFEQIVLHSSQEQAFFTCLDTLLGQLNELSASVSATATQQESAPESYCINHGLIPFVNKINEDATHINASVVELIQLLGGGSFDLSGIEALEVNRRTPGCEMLLEALKHCTTSMQECVSFAHIICQKLLNTSRRRLNPPLLGKLGAVGSALQSIGTHLSEIKDKISSEETLCYFCNKPNVSKAFGEFVEHFSDFTNVCFSGSESSINGILARYCSSMANIIATQTVQRVQHIQEIVQSITEDDAIFAFTMNDAVIPFLNEVRDSYIALYETQLPEKGISCGADAQIAILKTLDNCVADFQQKLLNLAGFISRETFFPPLFFTTYYQLEPDLTALVCQSFDKIYKSISQMAFKMQRKEVIYANNQRIVDVLTSIKNAPLSNLISRAYNVFACDYCNYSTSQIIPESEKVEGAISSVISASMYPTNLIAMKEVGLKIAIKAKEINKICEEFINNNSVTLAINEDLKSQLRMLGNSLYGARSFLHDTLKDQNGELTVDGIKYLHDHSATPLHEAVSSFVSMLNISWSSDANESVLREIDIENQLKLFFSAVANVATSLNIMLNVAKNAGQITYDHELVQTLDQVVTEINAMPAIALVTLHEHPIPFVESCAQFAETLHALQTTLADIVEELRRKCCSTFFPHVRNLSHGLQRFFIFLNEIVYSEQYKKMLIDPDAQHELLAYLCDPSSRPVDDGSAGGDSDDSPINPDAPTEIYSGLTGVNRELQKLLTLQSTTGDDCLTREITPTLERLTNIVNEAADVCKSFYTIHKIGVALADLPPPPSDAILCANNVMDEIVETLGHLKLISDYLNNIRYEPGYSLNSGLSAFDTLFSVLAQISENVEHLGRANLVLCPRCVSWPQIHIAAMAASLKPAHVDVKKEAEVNCCASFARETHIFAHWAEQLERAHDTLLTGFESKISPPNCFSIERKDVIDFTKIIQKFTEHSDKLYDPFIEMIALVNQYAVNNESCLAVICLPKMRSANDAILELLKFVHYTNGNATLKTPKFDAQFDCENRSLNIGAIIGSFNRILNRWYEFMNQWNTVLTLYEHFDFSQSFHKFEEVTVRLRQGISDWGEANYASGHPVFCLKCEEYIEPIRFENLMNTTWISNVFEEIIEKSDNCCSSVLQLTVCNIRKNMSNITNALYSASAYSEFENPYFTELIQRGPTFWTNLLAGLENFVATVLELKTLSFHAPCPDKVLNPVLMRLWNNVKKIQSAFGVQDEAVIPQKPFNNDVVDLANDFENLSVAWNSFCCAIDKNAPDKNRIDIANAMKRVNDNLTILYDNIASFKVLMNVNFCGGESITVDITPNLTETTRRIIFRTARLLPSLWAHNCCDVHAKCIYNAGKYLEHIDATINTEAVTNGSIRDDTCDKLCECLSALSVMINAFQYKVNTSVELGEDVHCVFLEAAEEFGQIQEALEQATSINPTPLSYPDWDAFTSSTRNDCESLGDLYRDLRQKLNMTFNTLLTQLEHKEVPVILGIYSGVDSVHAALTDAAEIMQRCEIARGSLCQSCQHRDVLRGINLIIEELNVARERLSLMARCPILQETQATYADSSRMIDLFFGQPNASRREGWTPLEAVRQSAIEANRAAAAFVKDLLRPAVVVNV